MKAECAKIRGIHPYTFMVGEWASVIGVAIVTPDGLPARPVFVVMYPGGQIDYIAISDSNYEMVSA